MGEFPGLNDKTIADIIHAAIYSDGEKIENGPPERGNGARPGAAKAS
ncbi:MAG: hypothetical protein ACUVS4_06940 [Chloroflexaceae bacterium]